MLAIEKRNGSRLVDKPKCMTLQDGGSPLCLTVDDVSSGWTSDSHSHVLSFAQVWSNRRFDLHTVFTLERHDRHVNSLACRITAQQAAMSSNVNNRQQTAAVVRVSLADLAVSVSKISENCFFFVQFLFHRQIIIIYRINRKSHLARGCHGHCVP